MGKLGTLLQVGRTFGVRDGILRLEYELQRGSGLMSWKMHSVQGWGSWTLDRIAPGSNAKAMRAARQDGSQPFFFSDVKTLGPDIKKLIGPEREESILAEAERILAGNLTFFGQLSVPGEFPPQWFQNAVTCQSVSAQQSWTQMRFASPAYGDLKFILEPSRFLFVYPLARAYAMSADERFPQAFWRAVEDWARQSPPMSGPLWICGQECSLRILAWSFALYAFIHSPSTTNDRVALLASMVAAHAWRTAQTIGYARSQRSNHLITEAVGLWTAGTLYPELGQAQVWQKLGAQLLREAVLDQITPQGVSQQHSFNYQRMNLHLLLWALRLAEIHRVQLDGEIRARTEAALAFISKWVDPVSGAVPNYGSDDGTLLFPLASGAYRDFRPLLRLGTAILNRPALKPGPWDEAALWFGAKSQAVEQGKPLPYLPSADAGYFRLGDAQSWAMIRAGKYTRRPFQADQLHVDLWWRGINVARDAGTYLYNGPPPWNNGFAGTTVHNTVTVDGRDQMRRASRFLWLDWAQASGRLYSSREVSKLDCFEGEHDGYRSLGIRHRRKVQWLRGAGWVIVDDIIGTGVHEARLHWLAADLPYEVSESPFEVVFTSEGLPVSWNIFASAPGIAAMTRAGEQVWSSKSLAANYESSRLHGWESPTYGELRPAISIMYETRSRLPVRFVTAILMDQRCEIKSEAGQLVILRTEPGNEPEEIYRVTLSEEASHILRESAVPESVLKA
jgi:Heparinase II/III-like protein/Heparinase II/III N-terminus